MSDASPSAPSIHTFFVALYNNKKDKIHTMISKRLNFFLLLVSFTEAFVSRQRTGWHTAARKPTIPRSMMPLDVVSDAITSATTAPIIADTTNSVMNSLLLATIDGDISKMSDNEFAPVFMGGLTVMFGGLLSVLFVGFIVNSKDLSAKIVADSYAQGADDEEFWKGLSEEERKKTQELLKRIQSNQNNGGGIRSNSSEQEQLPPEPVQVVTEPSVLSTESSSSSASDKARTEEVMMSAPKQEKKVGMFDDYGD